MKKILFVLLLLLVGNAGAQQPWVQSRFDGTPAGNICAGCKTELDKYVHVRFTLEDDPATSSINEAPRIISDGGDTRFEFTLQLRTTFTDDPEGLALQGAQVRLKHSTIGFGESLDSPKILNFLGQPNASAKCSYTQAAVFTEGTGSYAVNAQTFASGTSDLTYTVNSNQAADGGASAFDVFGHITTDFKNLVTINCIVADADSESGIVLDGGNISNIVIRRFGPPPTRTQLDPTGSPNPQRAIFPLAANDLRGFRLDGKTWAEDYARFDDGMGVRLKFSKGVYADNSGTKEALKRNNFIVEDSSGSTDTISITSIEHTAGDPYVTLGVSADSSTNNPAVGAVVRLVSGSYGALTVKDTGDEEEELADGNFVASLEYDADAPRVSSAPTRDTSFTTAEQSRWTLDFSDFIRPDTVAKEHLCITEPNGVCVAEGTTPTVSIVSVTTNQESDSTTTATSITVVINEGPGKVGGARSIEFRRNAVLAPNLKIVEDYQTALREQIQLQNRIGPAITVDDATMTPNPNNDGNYLNYDVSFTVEADEDVPGLATAASYALRRLSGGLRTTNGFTENGSPVITELTPQRKVTIVYNVTFFTAAVARASEMVLTPASNTSLTDGDPINPLGPTYTTRLGIVLDVAAEETLDEDGSFFGRVPIATIPSGNGPIITATAAGDAAVGSQATQYTGSFTVTVADASDSVPNLKNTSSYLLLRKIRANNTLAPVTGATLTAVDGSTTRTATINFSATLADFDAARETEYFTLGRSNPQILGTEELLDIYSRQPLSSADGNPAIDRGARISTGASSQANRVADNARLIVMATGQKANPASSNANQYTMTFEIDARDVESTDAKNLSDIGDKTAYTLIHIPTSGQPINFATDNSITVTSTGDTLAGSIADIQYTVTFPDTPEGLAKVQRTAGFTIGYAGNDKLLASNGDKPQRGNSSPIADGDPIAIVTGGVVASAAVAARDTEAPYLAITNNPTSTVMTNDNGATYTFSFTVTPSEAVQDLSEFSAYRLLVAGEQGDISGNTLTNANTTPDTIQYTRDDAPATIEYVVSLSAIRALSAFSSEAADFVPYGFLLARNNDAFRDTSNNEPVKANDAGDAAATPLTEVENGDLFQDGKVAVLDQQGTVITLTDDTEAVPDDDNRFGEVYNMTFTVEASEDVTGIGDIDNYTLMRVKANNTVVPAVISGDPNAIRVSSSEDDGNPADNAMGDEASFTYTVTFRRNNATDLTRIRDTKGFTLALSSGAAAAGVFQDVANNPPVNTNNEEIYDSSNALQRQGLIPPIPAGAAPEVIAARDRTAQAITFVPNPTGSFALPNDDDPTIYSGSFTVSSTENIRDIGTPGAYRLGRVSKSGGIRTVSGGSLTLTSPSDNDANRDGRSAVINFSGADVGDLADARDTRSFVLSLNIAREAGTRLRDYSNNVGSVSGDAVQKDTTDPVITVTAIDIEGDIGTDSDGVYAEPSYTSGVYTMQFRVTASEDVPTLNNTASYNLVGIDISDGTTVTIVQNNVTPAAHDAGNSRATTLTYTVTDITNPTSLAGFTLVRHGAESLRDKSGNLPAAAGGERLDSNAASIALRDTTPPRLTVTAQGTSPKAVPSADGTAYSMTFVINSTEFLRIPGATEDRYFLASVDTSSPPTITNLNIEADNATIIVENEITLPFNISGITDPTNIKAFTLVRRGDLMIDFSGNPVVRHDGSAIAAEGDLIDDRDAALADRDTTPPRITVTGMDATADENDVYTVRFTVNATEPVKDLNVASSYRLVRIGTSNSLSPAFPASFTNNDFTEVTANREYTIEFTVHPTGANRNQIRSIKGYTLGRAGATSFIDRSGNSPVKADGTTSISNAAGSIIAAVSGGIIANAEVSLRDTDPPQLTVTDAATSATLVARNTFGGAFRVTAEEDILNIGLGDAYRVLRVLDDDSTTITAATLFNNVTLNGSSADINFEYEFTGSDVQQDIEDTKGFTLARADNAAASDNLIDYASNIPVDPDNTNQAIDTAYERLDSRASAIVLIDTESAPSIMVTAVESGDGGDEAEGARDSADRSINTYTMRFQIRAGFLEDIGDPDAYILMRVPSVGDAVAITTATGTLISGNLAGSEATIEFTGKFASADLAAERDTIGFTLGRATDADSGSNCKLCSSGVPPEVAAGARLDARDEAIVPRDMTPPQLAVIVRAIENLEQLATPAPAVGGNMSGLQADGTFYLRFNLYDDDDDIPDIKDALTAGCKDLNILPGECEPDPNFPSAFRVLRKTMGSNTLMVVNGRDGNPALPIVRACKGPVGTGIGAEPGCYYFGVGGAALSATDATNTEYFTLGRATPDGLRDGSNNDPIVANHTPPNTVVRAVGDPSGPLPLNSAANAKLMLEREAPWITVKPRQFNRRDNHVCGTFEVSGSDLNSASEPIDGINEAGSYRLLRINPDNTVNEVTNAGPDHANCEGSGSAISDVTSSDLLTARVSFNVMDSGVTINHSYTLGRKAKLTDISGNALVDPVDTTTTITTLADASGRIDSRDDALNDITTNPSIRATARDTDGNTSDRVEAIPDTTNPLIYRGSFRVEVVQRKGQENVPRIGTVAAYRLVYISVDNEEEAISNQSISISNVMANRAATVDFTATLPNLATVRDVASFKLQPVDLVNDKGNPPSPNEFSSDSTNVRRDRTPPRITIAVGDQGRATADVNNVYRMQFILSANEAVGTLGNVGSYSLRRIQNNNTLVSVTPQSMNVGPSFTANRQYTINYAVDLSSLGATEIRNTRGFTLVRAGANSLADRSSNLPVKNIAGSPAIAVGDPIAAVSNGAVAATGVALRETVRPQIEVRPVLASGSPYGAVPHATLENTYVGSFTVRSVSGDNLGEHVKGLGVPENYAIHRVFHRFGGSIAQTSTPTITSSDSTAQQNVTIGFQVSFLGTQEEINTAIKQTTGFTLAAASLNLIDYASNLPQGVDAVGDRLDTNNQALATVNRAQPRITVVAGNYGNAVSDSTKLVYTASFTATAPEGTPIIGLESVASYKVLRIAQPRNPGDLGSPFEFDNAIITALGTGDQNQAEFEVTATFDDLEQVQASQGITLARLTDLRARSGLLALNSDTGRGWLDRNDAAIARVSLVNTVVCSPFYPNIGQQEVFLRIANEGAIDLDGLTLTKGTTTIFNNTAADTVTVERIGGVADEFGIFKVSLGSEITDDEPIMVSYSYEGDDSPLQTDCSIDDLADLMDSDADGVNDIVDNNPYDADVTSVNTAIATASLYETPASRDTFYNRRVLVRSLLRGDEFTYIEAGEKKSAGGVALTIAEYFGIDYATNTKLLEVADGSFCELMLTAARDSQLSQVKLDEVCASEEIGAAEAYDFVANAPGVSHRYIWVGVDDDGYLQPSDYPDHTITVLPEINIAGQSSYFYDKETTRTVVISGYAPNTDDTSVAVLMKDTVVSRGIINDETVTLNRGSGEVLFNAEKFLTAYQRHPLAGQTFRHWLTGSDNIWHATEATVAPVSGGHSSFDNAQYAIGADSYVDVRMAQDGSTEPITEIHQLVLYDVTEPTVSRVTSAIEGREYYLVADLTTNIENVGDETVVANQMAGYTIITTDTVVIREIGNSGHLIEQESFEIIAFSVSTDTQVNTISVGWDKIGTAENVMATYRVTEDTPAGYNEPGTTDDDANGDTDGDRIRNALDIFPNSQYLLQVAVDGTINAGIDDITEVALKPLYVSDEGLLIAAAEGDDMTLDYSAANIAYRGLTTDTRVQLGITDDDSITSLATFGIRSVDYGFSQENDNADASVVGGVAYAVFPLAQSSTSAQVFYISRYMEDIQQWERFERGTHIGGSADTWYVIDRESPNTEACPTDIELYKGTHETVGAEGLGFTANTEKCVMVAISDGGPYDNSGVDGRIDALLAMGTELPSRGLQCAAFYPNVGQTELFFALGDVGLNLNEFVLEQGGDELTTVGPATQINAAGTDPVLRVVLSSEITDDTPIRVSYTTDTAETIQRMCVADFKRDSDGDGIADIADNNPFDANDETINQNVASASLATTPASTDTFYNRRVLVRSLLRGNEFTYVENGEFKTAGGVALTAADYFGIDYAADTKLLRVQSGGDCAAILAVARANRLSKVKLDEFCTDDLGDAEDYDFVNEVSTDREQRYVWVGVNDDGYLVPSAYPDHTIFVLSEINISGQSSYFYAEPPEPPALPTNIIISAYAPDDTNTPIDITLKGTVVSGAPIADEMVTLRRGGGPDAEVYTQSHSIAGNNNNPQAGQTIRRWLTAGSSNVWQPGEANMEPIRGGYESFNDMRHAIGDHSYVDVRVAKDGAAEPVAAINQLLLYDVTETTVSRVTSVVQERTYYLVADLTTNIENVGDETVLDITGMDGWEELSTQHVVLREKISDTGDLEAEESFEIIAFRVTSDAGDTITVGWDRIGTAEDVLATYRATETIPANYNRPGTDDDNANGDRDGDRIRNALDVSPNSRFSLQVAVDGTIISHTDLLRGIEPLYVSDEGLIIAAAKGDNMAIDYSAANIAYSDLTTTDTRMLGIMGDDSLTSLATFGIGSVDYGFSQVNADADAVLLGGVAYATFPIQASVSDEVFYISRYNDEAGRWERIERGTRRSSPADTWYVIDKESFLPCASDPEIYRNEHRAVGDEGMGFTADNQKCVLVAITDGGPYDNSGVDGRVDALLAMGTKLQPRTQGMQCAAFYPNVGQRELFFELENIADTGRFEIAQGGNRLNVGSVRRIDAAGLDPVLRVSLGGEIVSDADIRVTYTEGGDGGKTFTTMCSSDLGLIANADGDALRDIADNNPFDRNDQTLNRSVVNPTFTDDVTTALVDPAAPADATVDFYSREVVVRSLLRGEEFTYIVEDENGQPIQDADTGALQSEKFRSTMTPAQYFGVPANTRTYRYSAQCRSVLVAARASGLTQVRIDEFCEDITADFVDVVNKDFVENGSGQYIWATVRGGGFLLSSYIGDTVKILPEINFAGQSSYLLIRPAVKTVDIAAYVGDSTQDITGLSVSSLTADTEVADPVILIGSGRVKETQYDLAIPQEGETITSWLSTQLGAAIWQPNSETLMLKQGGHDAVLRSYDYAIGTHNIVSVRAADPANEAEQITEIRQVLLYEAPDEITTRTTLTRVKSMVTGESYYLAVDYDTNISTQTIKAATPPPPEGIVLDALEVKRTTATDVISLVESAGHLEKEEVDILQITVGNADSNTDTGVITVGWDQVGSVENLISRYLVTTIAKRPLDYLLADVDLDGIPDRHDNNDVDNHPTDNSRLQVSIGDSVIEPDRDYLTTQDGNPTFLTYEGLVIANALNDSVIDENHYSVVHDADALDDDTQLLLGIRISDTDEIDTIATFGVAGVEYGFEANADGGATITGGVIYVSFPIEVIDPLLIGGTLYLGKYIGGRWDRFERGTGGNVDTWYAIERPSGSGVAGACPTDVQIYENEHEAVGDEDMGFTAHPDGNCIMVVITDGDRYDTGSSLDGRVIDPLSIGTKLFARATDGDGRSGGGGGGAIGVSDILLLIGALVLITVASRKRRRTY